MAGVVPAGVSRAPVKGYVTIKPEFGPPDEADADICPHCGMPWWVQKGSRRLHIFCQNCGEWTCDKADCLKECYPLEKKLDDSEGRKNLQQLADHGWGVPILPGPNPSRIIVP